MKKTMLSLGILLSAISQASELSCQLENGTTFKIVEDVPGPGLATLHFGTTTSTVQLTQTTQALGCFEYSKKKYFHPYYEVNLTSAVGQGLPNTRCPGVREGIKKFNGSYVAEMTPTQKVFCEERPVKAKELRSEENIRGPWSLI